MPTQPWIWLIAGPNGAGKTTVSSSLLPKGLRIRHFGNADLLAFGLEPFAPEKAAIRAGKLLVERVQGWVGARESFALETTLTSRYHETLAHQLKRDGWRLGLVYLWVAAPELAVLRVQQRIKRGGHAVPERDIIRRYRRSLNALPRYLALADEWHIYDQSNVQPAPIASKKRGRREEITQVQLFARLAQRGS